MIKDKNGNVYSGVHPTRNNVFLEERKFLSFKYKIRCDIQHTTRDCRHHDKIKKIYAAY